MEQTQRDTPTPRETRLRLNKMERWYRRHADRFTPEDQVFLRLAFEYAEKPADADVIAEALRAGCDGATMPPCTDGDPMHSPEPLDPADP